jgi:hypothetical protein
MLEKYPDHPRLCSTTDRPAGQNEHGVVPLVNGLHGSPPPFEEPKSRHGQTVSGQPDINRLRVLADGW